jgi:hypothetical protein
MLTAGAIVIATMEITAVVMEIVVQQSYYHLDHLGRLMKGSAWLPSR